MKISLIGTLSTIALCVVTIWIGLHFAKPQSKLPSVPMVTKNRNFSSATASTPGVGTPTVSPAVIQVSTPTSVVVSAAITGTGYIPGSANLLRLDANNKTVAILGTLHDDGINGDAVAGDGIYSLAVTVNENQTGSRRLQVSAAFRGLLRRVTSSIVDITVVPPDPGDAGKTTLAGIDSDSDGVRDDVQRYIALTYPSSEQIRAGMTQIVRNAQTLLSEAQDPTLSITDEVNLFHSQECLYYLVGVSAASAASKRLDGILLNTASRSEAWLAADDNFAGHVYALTPPDQRKSRCLFNPDAMPN